MRVKNGLFIKKRCSGELKLPKFKRLKQKLKIIVEQKRFQRELLERKAIFHSKLTITLQRVHSHKIRNVADKDGQVDIIHDIHKGSSDTKYMAQKILFWRHT